MLLTGLLFFYLFISSPLLHATLGYPLIARLAITLLLVGPLGFNGHPLSFRADLNALNPKSIRFSR